MKKRIKNQLRIGHVDICDIPIFIQSRDEIPQLLLGLQTIYSDRQVRDKMLTDLPDRFKKKNYSF